MAEVPNPWASAGSATPASSSGVPFAPLTDRVGTALTTPQVKNIGDVLDYQRAALAEFLFGKGNSDDDRAALRHAIGLDPKGFLASLPAGMGGAYADAPLPVQGLIDFALDTVTDPLTYETLGDSALLKLLGKGGAAAFRGVSHVTPAMIRNAAVAGAKAAVPAVDAAKNVARAGSELFGNAVNYGAEAARKLGVSARNVAVAAKATGNAYADEIARRFEAINKSIMAGLSPDQAHLVRQLQHGEIKIQDVTDDVVKSAYKQRKKLTDDLARLQAAPHSEGLRTITGQRFVTRPTNQLPLPREDRWIAHGARGPDPKFAGYEPDPTKVPQPFRTDYAGRVLEEITGQPILRTPRYVKGSFGKLVPNPALKHVPKNLRVTHMAPQRRIPLNPILQEFEGVPGEMVRKNYRPNYFPGTHSHVPDPNAPAKTIQPLEMPNEHLKHQEDFTITPEKADEWEKSFSQMLLNTAHVLGKNKTIDLLHKQFGKNIPAAIQDLMEDQIRGRGTGRTNKEVVEDAWKGVLNLPKIAIVGTSPAHMFNILSILLAHAPEAIPGMLKHFGELATTWSRDPAKMADKRWKVLKPWIDKGIGEAFADSSGYWTTHLPGIKQMNRATWDLDMSAVMALADHYERTGVAKGVDAAQRARQALVDYANKSPLTRAASWVAPFASFATESVKSVLGGIAKRPATNEAINRLTGGRYLGGGDRSSGTAYFPTAKVGRGIFDPLSLARSDLGLPVRQGIDAIPGVGKHTNNYLTYGEGPTPRWLLDEVLQPLPYGRDFAENAGLSNFKPPNPWLEGIEDATRIKLPDSMAPDWSIPPATQATPAPKAKAAGGAPNPWQ